jgi:import inner membrane translocase subunit TIM54
MSEAQVPPVTPKRLSGVRTVFKYTGLPTSWLDKRPKLPSRNWLIFLGVTSSIAGYYIYDRQKCKKLRQEYIDKVKDLAELPSSPLDKLRKVTVYGSKWPGDEDYDQSLRYFRKYIKVCTVHCRRVTPHHVISYILANSCRGRRGLRDDRVQKAWRVGKPRSK